MMECFCEINSNITEKFLVTGRTKLNLEKGMSSIHHSLSILNWAETGNENSIDDKNKFLGDLNSLLPKNG